MQGDYFILCTKASCQHFSPPRRNFFHHKSYSFLLRTVRLTNSNPKALLLGCRGTLAQNRGTMGVQIPFSFPKSLDFKPLQTKVRILPWQMKSTLIIKSSCPEMPCIAEFFVVLSTFPGIVFFLFKTTLFAKQRKTEQINTFCSSQIVVSQGGRLRMGVHYLTKGCSKINHY